MPTLRNRLRLLRLAATLLAAGAAVDCAAQRPNIIHILADDLGWGSVGFNGQTAIQTPHLDALAAGGMKFDNAYAATVCGPSRAMLYAGFHNGHTLVDRNQNLNGDVWRDDGQTVGDHLQALGYKTALFGKWGFGGTGAGGEGLKPNPVVDGPNSIPNVQGFETFYGYLDHARAHSYRVDSLWTTVEPADDDGDGVDEVGEKYATQPNTNLGLWLEKTGNNNANPNANYTGDLVTQKSREYIAAQAASGAPFYLQHASTIPHFDIDAVRDQPGWFDAYADVPGAANWSADQQAYAAMITRLDATVGELVAQLRDPNGDGDTSDSIMEDTLILFTSDNGATPEDNSPITFFNASGGKRGGKRDLWDGGINVPTFAYWEGTIAPGQTSERYTDLTDFAPTAIELAGGEARVGMDGVSLVHELTGAGRDRHKDYLIQEHHEGNGPDRDSRNGRWAILRDGYKLIKFANGDRELYHLDDDPDENAPLSFAVAANAALRDELEAIALAEGVERNDNYTVEFQDWTGAAGDDFHAPANWSGTAPAAAEPSEAWSALINNTTDAERVATASRDTDVLGLEVRGDDARQTLRVNRRVALTGRNEVRISAGGRLQLDDAELHTVRWVDIKPGAEFTGHGAAKGDIYNLGLIAPGLPADLPQPPDPPDPSPIPEGVDTGVIAAVAFDFNGVQDQAPLTSTSTQSEYLEVVGGLDFGPGLGPRHPGGGVSDAGDEFNVQGFQSGSTIQSAIAADDYLTFTVAPVFGVEMLVDAVSVRYWRNGTNAARQFGLMTSLDGFAAGQELATSIVHATSDVATHTLLASYAGGKWTQGPVETRFYGWRANTGNGNTHVNDVQMTASFRTIAPEDAVVFEFRGQGDGQNAAPLTATTAKSESLQIVSGVDLGPGLNFVPSSAGTDNGAEFNVASFAAGYSLADAILAEDYLAYTVQSVPGVEMQLRDIAFEFWRNNAAAPRSLAIMTSVEGFSLGDQLATLGPVPADDGSPEDPSDLIGFNARDVFSATASDAWTSEPVEVRLYGWEAADVGGNLHVTGAAMTAYFRSMGDPAIALTPTGVLSFDGDFFHVDGARIAIELAGEDQSDPDAPQHDQILVSGQTEVAGDLTIELRDNYAPLHGASFELLRSATIEGAFANVDAPELAQGLQWSLDYQPDAIVLNVIATGDFNRDGQVDASDYTLWRDGLGDEVAAFTAADADGNGRVDSGDYELWRANYGFAASNDRSVVTPEPSAAATGVIAVAAMAAGCDRPRSRPQNPEHSAATNDSH